MRLAFLLTIAFVSLANAQQSLPPQQIYKYQNEQPVINSMTPDLEIRLAATEEEVRRLTGMVETLAYRNKLLEQRLEKLQEAAPKPVVPVVPTLPKEPLPKEPLKEGEIDTTTHSLYNKAFSQLKAADYAAAEKSFAEFLRKYPTDALAGNAQYWLGETYYVRKDYVRGAEEFLKGYQKFPKAPKAPDNLLKLGLSLASLNNTAEACRSFQRLEKQYSDASKTALTRAKQEQARLKCGK
jgi:tol-pal system protein YbgF